MTEQTGRDAAVAVITEALNSAFIPSGNAEIDEMSRHDRHSFDGLCHVCRGDVASLAPRIANALTSAGLLVSTEPAPPGDVVETVRSLLAGPDALVALGSVCGTRQLAEAIASAMPNPAVTREHLELLAEIANRLTAHGDSIAHLYRAVDARPVWEAAHDLKTIAAELGAAQDGEQ